MKRLIAFSLLILLWANTNASVSAAEAVKNDWPRFRGPTGDGVSLAKGIPTTWSATQNVLWSVDLPKPLFLEGPCLSQYDSNTKKNTRVVAQDLDLPHAFNPWSSPIISGDKVFVATSGVTPRTHSLLCFNLADGKRLWETPIPPGPITLRGMKPALDNISWVRAKDGPPPGDTHIAVGYSIATPCTDGELVFVMFMSYVLTAVDFQGKIVWEKALAKETDLSPMSGHYAKEIDTTLPLCFSASPILHKDLVIQVTPAALHAFNRKTGEVKYAIPYSNGRREAWATPILVTFNDKTVIITGGLEGYDPENGNKILWASGIWNYGASPVFDDGYVFGTFGGASCTMFALPLDANSANDIRAKRFDKNTDFSTQMPAFAHGSPVVVDHRVYQYVNGYNQGGLPAKVQPDKGMLIGVKRTAGPPEIVHKIPLPGVSNWASPVATADGYIYVATGGRSYVVRTGPQSEVVGTNELDDYNIGPSPAVTDGKLIIRGASKLWCIGKQ